jgi:hypothetical protein
MAAVRTELARQFTFPEWWQSEDRAFRVWLSRQYPRICHIDRVLYRYNFRASKPEFGGRMYPQGGHMRTRAEVDAVLDQQATA